jgi:hypothetical protein
MAPVAGAALGAARSQPHQRLVPAYAGNVLVEYPRGHASIRACVNPCRPGEPALSRKVSSGGASSVGRRGEAAGVVPGRHYVFGQIAEFDVEVLRRRDEQGEGLPGGDVVAFAHDAAGFPDGLP